MNTTNEQGGKAATVVKWTTALAGVATLFTIIVKPVSDYFETGLRNAEIELKEAQIELERTKAKQAYVLAALGEFDDPEEELALLLFMQNEYNDPRTREWVKSQGIRLKSIIDVVAIEKEQQRRETEKNITDELEETGQGSEAANQIEQKLTTDQVREIRTQQNSILATELQLQAANQLISPTTKVNAEADYCEETNLRAVVYKPFSTDKSLSDYMGAERAGMIDACLGAQPLSALEWKVQYLGPSDRIAKRITCTCLSRYEQALHEERKGFRHLIDGEYDDAIAAFDAAEKIYPEFHQVYEISQLLRKHRVSLDDPAFRRNVYQQIVRDMAWKVPADLLEQIKQEIGESG